MAVFRSGALNHGTPAPNAASALGIRQTNTSRKFKENFEPSSPPLRWLRVSLSAKNGRENLVLWPRSSPRFRLDGLALTVLYPQDTSWFPQSSMAFLDRGAAT